MFAEPLSSPHLSFVLFFSLLLSSYFSLFVSFNFFPSKQVWGKDIRVTKILLILVVKEKTVSRISNTVFWRTEQIRPSLRFSVHGHLAKSF